MKDIKLNPAQREAAEHIYGPLLVLAGPGTGKTQLLSARIANILTKTDAAPQNILCLTFTENAALNMRERLASIIQDDAYDVHINTYHGFGSDIIRQYPEFFESIDLETGADSRLERPIDDLQRIQIVTDLVNRLPYSSPLISARHFVKNVSQTISELKRGLYTPKSLKQLAEENLKQARSLSPAINDILSSISRLPSTAEKAMELFSPILEIFGGADGLAKLAQVELNQAMETASETNKSKPLTDWKNKWLHKDSDGNFTFTDETDHMKIAELARIFQQYQDKLTKSHLYDFDDMILRCIEALKTKPELKFNLQEKYQFILLDEFQDTNAAQFELVCQLADNPVNEGQPNIFAVGDDDQAIYAFQGAMVSNMLAFKEKFRDVKVINLTENYRSHPDVLHVAHNIASQIETRLHKSIDDFVINKTLTAASDSLPADSTIERHEFDGEANEYSWVASHIKKLIDVGVPAREIAIIAPMHKYLESMVPFLAHLQVPVSYEKRENILETSMIRTFRLCIELLDACAANDTHKMNELFPRVLSLDHYQLPVTTIWKTNWAHHRDKSLSWAEHALQEESLAPHVQAYLALSLRAQDEPLEYMLDYLTGSAPLYLDESTSYLSPLRAYYFADRSKNPLLFYESLANLSTIREHLRAWQSGQDQLLHISDFIKFIDAYDTAEQPLINTHPIALTDDSVQLMTTYKAKGLEFEHVFLLSVHDDVWGKSARGNTNKVSLPANLTHIRYMGSGEDELRRLLFVAITRAKHGLYLTSHTHKDNGKSTEPVKYLLEFTDGEDRKTTILPKSKQKVSHISFSESESMQAIDIMWHSRHIQLGASLKSLLKPRLDRYQMSPTHLNTFIDLEYGGPEEFLLRTLLRFPHAPGEDGEYGNAIHYALERHQIRLGDGKKSSLDKVLKDYDHDLAKRYITPERMDDYRLRGHNTLKAYLGAREDMFALSAKQEVEFYSEGVLLGESRLSGKIDRLEVNKSSKTVHIVDFKTGKPYAKWAKELKLLKYRQQLYFYKFLVEGSHTWRGYTVASARVEFVEPIAGSGGKVVEPLYIDFDTEEEKVLKQLIQTVWEHIMKLELTDTIRYESNYKGSVEFIEKLVG